MLFIAPLANDGFLDMHLPSLDKKRIRIRQVQLEQVPRPNAKRFLLLTLSSCY